MLAHIVTLGLTLAAGWPGSAAPTRVPEFNRDVAPILFRNCVACHREGQAAPFALTTYDDARKRARLIAEVTQSHYMPPWHAAPGDVPIQGERRLTEDEIGAIHAWARGGTPEGNPRDRPALPEFAGGWRAGEPDLVLEMTESFDIPADGLDIYRNFVIPTDLPEDKWVTAVEFRPSAKQSSHHAIFVVDTTGSAVQADARDRGPGFNGFAFYLEFRDTLASDFYQAGMAGGGNSFGNWSLGSGPFMLPKGFALRLPKGAAFVIQMHFHPSGKPEVEKASVGFHFADGPPARPIAGIQIPPAAGKNAGIYIPAGEKHYVVRDSFTTPVDLDAYGAAAHAHYLGKEMKLTAAFPSGESKTLLWIDRWDFSWQEFYDFAEPVRLPAGTRLDVEIIYDNSAANPANPRQPPRDVRWGPSSDSEMGSMSLRVSPVRADELTRLDKALTAFLDRPSRKSGANATRERLERILLERYDKDGDGKLDADEREAWAEAMRSRIRKQPGKTRRER